jgi:hypothetical protein
MNAYEVAKPLKSGIVDGFTFAFGVDEAKVAAQLRKLADAIEGKTELVLMADDRCMPLIVVERVTHETTADREDFTTSKITIIVAERIKT